MPSSLPRPQGRNWLPKTGWASSNAVHRAAAARRHLLICQNLGGQLATLPTRHLRPTLESSDQVSVEQLQRSGGSLKSFISWAHSGLYSYVEK